MKNRNKVNIVKRISDIIIALSVLILFLPIWIVIAFLIKLTSKGPVFFVQDRPGQYKKIIKVYKFRTMKEGSEKMIKGKEVMKDDKRITPIGKILRRTKIDEIPQLFNIVKGEMSIVGPRPERISSLKDYDDIISKRLDVKPGLTGLAQVNGNIYIPLQERYKLDVYYAENYSIKLDLKIIIKTMAVVIFGEEKFKKEELD